MKHKIFLIALLFLAISFSKLHAESDTLWTRRYDIPGSIKNAIFSPDDSKILVTGTETFFEVNPENGDIIRELPELTKGGVVGINPETNIGLTYNCQLVNLIDYKKIRDVFSTKYFDTNVTLVYNIAHTPDLKKFAMVYYNPDGVTPSSVIIKDIEKENETLIYSEGTIDEAGFYTCALSPDGKYLATISNYIGDINTKEDNKIFIKLFDLNTNKVIKKLEFPDSQVIWTMKFSPDASMLAVNNGYVNIYSIPELKYIDNFQFIPKINQIYGYEFTKDSQYMILINHQIIQTFSINKNQLIAENLSTFILGEFLSFANTIDKILISNNSNFDETITILNNKITSVQNSNSQLLYPNPTTGQLIIKSQLFQKSNFKLQIINSNGQNIITREYQSTYEEITLDVSNFPIGNYYINIESNYNIVETLKFIKE